MALEPDAGRTHLILDARPLRAAGGAREALKPHLRKGQCSCMVPGAHDSVPATCSVLCVRLTCMPRAHGWRRC